MRYMFKLFLILRTNSLEKDVVCSAFFLGWTLTYMLRTTTGRRLLVHARYALTYPRCYSVCGWQSIRELTDYLLYRALYCHDSLSKMHRLSYGTDVAKIDSTQPI